MHGENLRDTGVCTKSHANGEQTLNNADRVFRKSYLIERNDTELQAPMSNYRISDADRTLFREAVKQIRSKPASQNIDVPQIDLSDAHHEDDIGSETALFYCGSSLPHQRLKALKKGQLPLEARLDLHGLNKAEAKTALIQFIHEQSKKNHRVCLVIHGKGGVPAVLKTQVNHWLRQIPQVLGFRSARPQHGGMGALYVLLKSSKID